MQRPDLTAIAFEQIGPRVFAPGRRLKARLDLDQRLMFVTLPGNGRSVRRHVLNQTAAAIYRLFDGTRPVSEIIALFAAKFPDIPPAELAQSILVFTRTLERKGIIDPASSPEAGPTRAGGPADAS